MAAVEPAARFVCVGGAILDRKLVLAGPAVPGSSNPVSSSSTAGGVARNVAENLSRLGHQVAFVGALGDDGAADRVLAAFPPGVDVSGVTRHARLPTAEYQAVLDPGGDLVIGLVDGGVLETMDIPWVNMRANVMRAYDWVVVDTNLPADGLAALLDGCRDRQVAIATVSVAKMARLPRRLDGVALLICNRDEAVAFTGSDDPRAITALGVAVAVVTDGPRPVWIAWEAEILDVPVVEGRQVQVPVDVTGAGDALFAGTVSALSSGAEPPVAVRFGHACASLTIESDATVRPDLTRDLALRRLG